MKNSKGRKDSLGVSGCIRTSLGPGSPLRLGSAFLLAVIITAACPPAELSAAAPAVIAIDVQGNERVDRSSIERALLLKIGEPFDRSRMTPSLKALYALGTFRTARIDDVPEGEGVRIVVRVEEFPMVRGVEVSGNKALTEADVKRPLKMKSFGFYDPAEALSDREAILDAYRAAGYYGAEVAVDAQTVDRGVRLVYTVVEGRKTLVKEIDILGNRALSDKEVLSVLQTGEMGPMSWLSESGVLKPDLMKDDLTRITLLYLDKGYLEARVEEPQVRLHPEGDGLYVAIRVEEGPRFVLGNTAYSGDWEGLPSFLRGEVSLKAGHVFERARFLTDLRMLEDSWRDQGYAWAKIEPLTRRDKAQAVVDVDLRLTRGDLVKVRRIDIKGNLKTRDYVIRREMRLMEGDLFSQKKLEDSRRYIRALGYFDTVAVDLVDTGGGSVDMLVKVQEGSSGTLSAGFAYSSVEGLVGTLKFTQANLFGRGQRLSVDSEFGGERSTYSVSFTEPRIFSGPFSLGVDVFKTTREYSTYTQDSTGGGVRVGYRLSDTDSLSLRYRRSEYEVRDVDIDAAASVREQEGRSVTSSMRLGYTHDTRDFPMDPRTGAVLSVTTEFAGGFLGGTNDFVRNSAEASGFVPLAGDLIGSAHAEAAIINSFGGDEVPVTERFFMGGLYTLRGFEYRRVGPMEDGEPLGGSKMLLVNMEAAYPLVRDANIKGVLFVDAGNVWGDGEEISTSDLRVGAGFGFRWVSPMGLLRLEWGFNLDPRPDEVQPGWEFSIGNLF